MEKFLSLEEYKNSKLNIDDSILENEDPLDVNIQVLVTQRDESSINRAILREAKARGSKPLTHSEWVRRLIKRELYGRKDTK